MTTRRILIHRDTAASFPRNSPDWSDEPFVSIEALVANSFLYSVALSLFNLAA